MSWQLVAVVAVVALEWLVEGERSSPSQLMRRGWMQHLEGSREQNSEDLRKYQEN